MKDPAGQQPSQGPGKEQWVLAGWLIDGRGGPRRHNVLVGIAGGRLSSLETPDERGPLPAGTLDCSNATLLPPLIDAHVHLALCGTRDPSQRTRQLTPTRQTAFTAIAGHLEQDARHGILAVRDGGDRYGHVLDFRNSDQQGNHGRNVHLAATCWAWHAPGRYGRMIGRSPDQAGGLAQAVRSLPAGVGHLKLIHSGINSLDAFGRPSAPQFDFEDLRAAVGLAHRAGLPVMVHANGEAAVRQALRAGCDSIEHGYFMGPDNLARLADGRIAWVPTVAPMEALAHDPALARERRDVARRTRDHQLEQIQKAHALGVALVLGSDAGSLGVDHGIAAWQELACLHRAGLSAEAAVFCATGRAAGLLGLRDRHVIAPGKPASFIVVQGGPEELLKGPRLIDGLCLDGVFCRM